jgi:long-chain acyl-CoA synthetase
MFNFRTFVELLQYIDETIDNPNYLSYLENGVYKPISSKQFVSMVNQLSNAFALKGVGHGKTVAIVSDSSPFWLMVDFALQNLGAISVPIFANISKENLYYEIEDAEIDMMFLASQEKYEQLGDAVDSMRVIVTVDVESDKEHVVNLFDFIENAAESFSSINKVEPDDIATIIYTSGSTGTPKGVELTHRNFMTQIHDVQQVIPLHDNHVALSFLPLAHIFERMVVSYYLACNVSIYFADDVQNVGNLIKEVKPTLMTVVPRLLEKISTKMHANAMENRGIKWLIAKVAFHAADTKDVDAPPSFIDKLSKKLVYGKLLEALGGNIEMLICGGAPLASKTERFFTNIGLNLYQGYGLSETSPVISVNTPSNHRFATTGQHLPSVEAKLLDDGELIVRGPSVMKGYHKRPDKTAETIVDGWLYTGDLAEIDKDGYISIKSRKKELFKTSTGKYVSAIPMEQALTQSKWIDYAVVVADNRPFVTALIFLEPVILESYAQEKNLSDKSFVATVENPYFDKLVSRLIWQVNKHLNSWEKIRKFKLIAELPTIENHVLTPSMKVSREKAYTRYENEIETMYLKNGDQS